MSVDVRPILDEELPAWGDSMARTFHVAGVDPQVKAAMRRERLLPGDLDRMLGVFDGPTIVGTFRSFPEKLTMPGGGLATVGAVTAVTVSATHRRRGLMSRMVERDLRTEADHGEVASILIAAQYPIYGRFGYGHATDHATWTFTRSTISLAVPPVVGGTLQPMTAKEARQMLPKIFDAHRRRQAGEIERRELWWDGDLGLVEWPGQKTWKGWVILHRDADGTPDGYLRYHVDDHYEERLPESVLFVDELVASDPEVEAELWRYAFELDLIATIKAENRRVDEPILWRLLDARAGRMTLRADFMWVRPLDVPRLLEARSYESEGRVVLEVVDDAGFADGCYALEATVDGATCRPTTESAGLRLPVSALGSIVMGGVPVSRLARARRLDVLDSGALAVADRLFWWPIAPWCSTWF